MENQNNGLNILDKFMNPIKYKCIPKDFKIHYSKFNDDKNQEYCEFMMKLNIDELDDHALLHKVQDIVNNFSLPKMGIENHKNFKHFLDSSVCQSINGEEIFILLKGTPLFFFYNKKSKCLFSNI